MSKLILVRYNDYYGNGTDKKDEVILKSRTDFVHWLKQHNAEREEHGEMEETADEFDLIEVDLFKK
jgi:predicted class III extradiol MEMO1 family dioxygenase